MTAEDIRRIYLEELVRVAPDLNIDTIDENDDLQDDLELDSMDVLNLVTALHQRLGVNIPEKDYPSIATLAKATKYLLELGATS
jgi:acyl carrier protein